MGDGPSGRQPTAPPQRNTGQRVVVWLSIAAIVIVLVLIGAQVIPRWWSQRVASVVDGSLSTGALYGLFIGFVFTLVPLVLLALVIRYRHEGRSWKGWIGWFVLVLLTAAPNLMTLGIVIGRSGAAQSAERTLDAEAPGFRLWSLIGAIAGALAMPCSCTSCAPTSWSRDENERMRREMAEPRTNGAHGRPRIGPF